MGTHDWHAWNDGVGGSAGGQLTTTGEDLSQNEDTWVSSEKNAQAKGC